MHKNRRLMLNGKERRRLSCHVYAHSNGYPVPGENSIITDEYNDLQGKIRLSQDTKYIIEDFVIECHVVFDTFKSKILDTLPCVSQKKSLIVRILGT